MSRALRCHLPFCVSSSGTTPVEDSTPPPTSGSVFLLPIEPVGDAAAVALVPDAAPPLTLLNGVRVEAGLHVLRHADHLAVDGRAIWLSIVAEPDEVDYDPEAHGDPLYCFRTKVRLEVGDRLVICRGVPVADCGMKFSVAAWEAGLPCHQCAAAPNGERWAPPEPRPEGALDRLLQLAGGI